MSAVAPAIEVGLNAAIVSVGETVPKVLVVPQAEDERPSLPFGPFDPLRHRTFERGLRDWVGEQTGLALGYVEQLYTFGDRGRHTLPGDVAPHVVSVGYLALTRQNTGEPEDPTTHPGWRPVYQFLPWEDWREGRPGIVDSLILPALFAYRPIVSADRLVSATAWDDRIAAAFGSDGASWDEERVLDRYEILYEAGLVEEAVRDDRSPAGKRIALGVAMRFDHRRILATALARLRAKLKYRPVIFELLTPEFTLGELQRVVEAIAGRHVHKQNFRRFVETTALVEPTGGVSAATGGRPAQLFRFRPEVARERPAPGIRLGRA